MILTYYTNIRNGRMQDNVRTLLAKDILSFEGSRVEVTIKRIKSTRSGQQNRYIHALFTIFTNALNELGNEFSMLEVKELCKAKFSMVDVVNEKTGECIGQRIKGTHEMSKGEMIAFIDKVIAWASEYFGIILPIPNEEIEINFEN